jgi:hypothetical protein
MPLSRFMASVISPSRLPERNRVPMTIVVKSYFAGHEATYQ